MGEQTITTSAVGRASGEPDRVDVEFAASAEEPDVASVRATVAEQATRLRNVLDAAGVPADRIRTRQFSLRRRPAQRWDGDPEERPFGGTERVSVTVLDLDRLGDVLSSAVDEAAVEVKEVAFTFRPATRRELQREAIADAVATARKKADAAAAAEDLTVDDVRSMATGDGSRPRRTGVGQQLAVDTKESRSVESGPIDVTVTVEVEYLLAEN